MHQFNYIKLFLAHSGNTLITFLLPKRIAVTVIFHSGLDMTDNMNPYGYTMSMTLTTFKIFFVEWISCFLVASQVFAWPHVGDIWQDSQFPVAGGSQFQSTKKWWRTQAYIPFQVRGTIWRSQAVPLLTNKILGMAGVWCFFARKFWSPKSGCFAKAWKS